MLLRTLFTLFCISKNANSLVFNRFRTLGKEAPGMGYPLEPDEQD
jgi:hypothetical protein